MTTATATPVVATAADTAARTRFVEAMGQVATGVTVVATEGGTGRCAQTVSAMCSVSADPPMVLVCVNRRSPAAAAILAHGAFAVNVLADSQADVSDTFAGRPTRGAPYDFAAASWHAGPHGQPLLDGAVAGFECRVASAHQEGSHTVFVGSVLRSTAGDGTPLVYHGRGYARPIPVQ